MLQRLKLFLLFIMMSFLGNNVSADYEKLAYDFMFKDFVGSALNLSEYKGKIIVVVVTIYGPARGPPGPFFDKKCNNKKIFDIPQTHNMHFIAIPLRR